MRYFFTTILLFIGAIAFAQKEKDTVLRRCPIFIIDTLTSNNYFLEYQPATVKVFRAKGKLTILIQQKDQYFTLFFRDKNLENRKYKIVVTNPDRNEVEAKYSFRAGTAVSYVSISQGFVETQYNKEKEFWHIKVNGLLTNLAGRTVSVYKVKADFNIE